MILANATYLFGAMFITFLNYFFGGSSGQLTYLIIMYSTLTLNDNIYGCYESRRNGGLLNEGD